MQRAAFVPAAALTSSRVARAQCVCRRPMAALPARGARVSAPAARPRAAVRMVAGDEAAAGKGAGGGALSGASKETAITGGLFLLWYAFNIVFNLLNKQVLNAWSRPYALSTFQLGVGSAMVLTQWALKITRRPRVTRKLLKALFLPTVAHLVGHVSTCISFSYVAVSFAHIIKAAEPAVSSVGSAIFLGEVYGPAVYLSLLPIIAGVSLSAVSELSFSWPGFLFAMLSNVAFAARNVFSKRNMGDFKNDETLTPANIYGLMSVMALLIEIPFALAFEGVPVLPAGNIGRLLLGSGVFYTLYNTVSFMALGRTGVVTHAVGNILKRASVIIVSILFFRNPITPLNAAGMLIAILGTAMYAFAKRAHAARAEKAKSA